MTGSQPDTTDRLVLYLPASANRAVVFAVALTAVTSGWTREERGALFAEVVRQLADTGAALAVRRDIGVTGHIDAGGQVVVTVRLR